MDGRRADRMQTGYRRDIDGLRAVAVLGVVLYHYGLGPLGAGFAGVDIFFVISGFLIGGIILDERDAGTFSYFLFYRRRIKRILPALLVMMLTVAPVASLFMSPNELRYFGGGIMATLLFASNIWFYFRIDYFNPGAALDPLVHTWSLGVEEQFYIVVPLVLLTVGARRTSLTWVAVGSIAVASLALMIAHHSEYRSASFYMIQYRAWELAAGTLAAMAVRSPRISVPSFVASTFAMVGLILIVTALIFIPSGVLWPSLWSLIPVVGTVLVLVFGAQTSLASRVLSAPPLMSIGLLSYSLYLWHQPIYSLTILARRDEGMPVALRVILFLAAIALAWLSWRFVERPYRNGAMRSRVGRTALSSGLGILVVFAVGGHITKGYPQRLPAEAQAAIMFENSEPPTYHRCSGRRLNGDKLSPTDACTHGAKDVDATVAIWGDSHAASIAQPIGLELAKQSLAIKEFTLGGCPPIPDVINILQMTNTTVRKSESCSDYTDNVRDFIVADPNLKVVVLFAYWNNYLERHDFNAGNGRIKSDKLYSVPLGSSFELPEADRLAALQKNLSDSVSAMIKAGKKVLIIYPLPEAPFDVPQEYAWAIWKGRVTDVDTAIPRYAFDSYSRLSREMLDGLGTKSGLSRLDMSSRLCNEKQCSLVASDGAVLYRDGNHLSLAGSALVVPGIAAAIATLVNEHTYDNP